MDLSLEHLRESMPLWIKNRYLAAALIIVVALILARVVDFIITRVCRVLAHRTKSTLDDRFVEILHQPVRATVILLGLWLATARLMLPPQPSMIAASVIKTIALFVWTVFAFRFVGILIHTLAATERNTFVQPRTRPLFENVGRIILFALAIYFIFVVWSIDVSAWLASAGIVGIAVGFAAKDTIANLFSGVSILADAPYKVGDYINLDTGERGEVKHIGLRSTRLLTRDDVEVTIPNAVIAAAKIVNESGGPWAKERIRLKVGVAYGSDVDQLRELLVKIAVDNAETCDNPAPRVRFRAFGDSSLDFELLCWIDEPGLRGKVTDALLGDIYKALNREGIEIPYPKRDVYIREMPAGLRGDNA